MLLMLDNFDSFTYNLYDYFAQLNVDVCVKRNNVSLKELKDLKFKGLVLSPGPGKPENAGNMMEVIEHYHSKLPILGICLGHQALGSYFGAEIVKAKKPMHGKVSEITLEDTEIFKNLPTRINVVRYHSLVVKESNSNIKTTSFTDDNEIMSIKHFELPIDGIQFHPEAYLTKDGIKILQNWVSFNNLVN